MQKEKKNVDIFIENMLKYMKEKNISRKEIRLAVGISPSYFQLLISKKSNPSILLLEKISKFLNVPFVKMFKK